MIDSIMNMVTDSTCTLLLPVVSVQIGLTPCNDLIAVVTQVYGKNPLGTIGSLLLKIVF